MKVWMVVTHVLIGSTGYLNSPTEKIYRSEKGCDLVASTANSLNTIPNTSFVCKEVEVKE